MLALWQLAIVAASNSGDLGHPAMRQLLDLRNLHFPLGIAAAVLAGNAGVRHAGPICAAGTALMAIAGLAEFQGWVAIPRFAHILTVGTGAMMAIVGLASFDLQANVRPHRLLRLLGEASYSVYLVHYALLSALAKLFVSAGLRIWLPPEGWFLVLSALATAGGIAFHLAVEKPLLSYCQKRVFPRTSSQPGAGQS